MIPTFDKVHNRFKLNSITYSYSDLTDIGYSLIKEGEPFSKKIGRFLLDWMDDKDYIEVKTSGSTGRPRSVKIKKQAMVNSAIATGDYFHLSPGDKALMCLPAEYIAGRMMLIRGLILGLELDVVKPTLNPEISRYKTYDFCAMLPAQLRNSLDDLNRFKTIIVGGASIPNDLLQEIQSAGPKIYETYGMTETITHIAVRPINEKARANDKSNSWFKCLPNVTITQNKAACLQIEAPHLFEGVITTNDMVRLHSKTEFEWLGRIDNVINSGGLKLNPEQIEKKLSKHISQRFFVSSQPHNSTGEQLILVVEGDDNEVDTDVFQDLGKYEIPKSIYAVPQFEETATGKIQREKTLKLLK